MTTAACEPFFLRLIDGETPAEAPDLAAHLGACLDCYRALTELRDAPRLATALRASAPLAPDPAFLDGLAARVWDATHVAPAPAPGLLARLAALLARPLPAALAGGLATAVLVLAVQGPATSPIEASAPPARPAILAPDISLGDDELPPADLSELGEAELGALLDRIGDDDGSGTEEEAEVESFLRAMNDDSTSAIEGVSNLGADELRAVDRALRDKAI